MQWNRLYKERNPIERGDELLIQKETQIKRAQHHFVNTSLLFINEKPIVKLARGRAYAKLSFFSLILTALILSVLSL